MAVITSVRPMTIGQLAAAARTSITRVRFYERAGLFSCACRTVGGHRKYDGEQLRRLLFILKAREFGFGLKQISALLMLTSTKQAPCAQARTLATRHLASVRAEIAQLTKLEQILADAIEGCSDNRGSICPVLELLNCSPTPQPTSSAAKVNSV
jgi:MerR family transcriptional regulator, mercuric resistance operon regulatory protein